jgi:hypothetical protein
MYCHHLQGNGDHNRNYSVRVPIIDRDSVSVVLEGCRYSLRIREWFRDIVVESFIYFLCLCSTFMNVVTKQTAIGLFP